MQEKEVAKQFSIRRILIPIIIGLGFVTYMIINNLSEVRFEKSEDNTGQYFWSDGNGNNEIDYREKEDFSLINDASQHEESYNKLTYQDILGSIQWSDNAVFYIILAILMMLLRDVAYMYRIRVLTDNQLSWRQSFNAIMLWELSSAITPSVVGGAGIAIFILNREGVSMGRSTATVMTTAMLDELFYIISVPIVILIVGAENLFPATSQLKMFGYELPTKTIFYSGYLFLVLLTLIILLSVFFFPQGFKRFMFGLTKISFLKKWRRRAIKTGDEMIITSQELKGKNILFWLKAFFATALSWTGRFWVVNFIILLFVTLTWNDHLMIYARQLVMWVIMLISPTPGSSGVAEFTFQTFLGDFIGQEVLIILTVAIIWRLISYYPYLIIGSIIFPTWLRKTAKK